MLTCPNGHDVDAAAAYCSHCGAAVNGPAPAAPVFLPPAAPVVAAVEELDPNPSGGAGRAAVAGSIWRRPVALGIAALIMVAAVVGVPLVRASEADGASGGTNGPAVTATPAAPETTTVTGTFVLTDYETAEADCFGDGGYSDMSPGTPVILTNEANVIVGSSSLGIGTANASETTCTYSFSISDVPIDQAQYAVEVGDRGKVVHSQAELSASSWAFSLSMG
jgi:hypothetical protein